MKINENMSAILTNKQLLRTEKKMAASMERLSSGFKINKPGDNPAGMAISNKMKAQIDALDQAKDNTSNAVSVIQIADGALNEVSNILQRMRELSVQAATGTNSYDDKKIIQDEINQLKSEVDRISTDTEYNTKVLLDGSSENRIYAVPNQASRINVSETVNVGSYELFVEEAAEQAKWEFTLADVYTADGDITINDIVIDIPAGTNSGMLYEKLLDASEEAGYTISMSDDGKTLSLFSNLYGNDAELTLSVSKNLAKEMGIDTYPDVVEEKDDFDVVFAGKDAKVKFKDDDPEGAGFSTTAIINTEGNRVTIKDINGFSMDFLLHEDYEDELRIDVTDIGAMTVQIGGNQYQTMDIRIPEVSTESMYLDTIDVAVSHGAERAMSTLDDSIAYLSATRSRLGAYQNRLDYATNSLSETNEDMTSAYSTLMDTDMAEEMTEYTQQSVLEQAAISVLSQANEMPQTVLSLLQ